MLDWFTESVDGAPLIVKIQDLWTNFPYDRTPRHAILLLRPSTVAMALGFYLLISKPLFRRLRKALQQSEHYETYLRVFIAVHNLLLAIFSLVVAVGSWHAVISHAMQFGLGAVYCDNQGLWNKQQHFGQWAVLFYISKYYEFVDTWILVLKGKPASFLQVYHHTGIAIIMWCAILSQSAWLIFVVLLNSVIHTLMYSYFFLRTIAPNVQIKSAKYLTMAQIGQFLTGITCTFGVFYWGDSCASQSSRVALAMLHLYGYGLVGLFFAFAQRKYKKVS
jgi:GNS1/SUR4 family